VAIVAVADPEDLVERDAPVFEAHGRPGHVELPDPGPPLAGQGDGLVPLLLEVGHPVAQGGGVVLPERLHIAHFEASVLHGVDHLTDVDELTVGEDVAGDK
jgi:hypothetical protein